MIATDGRKDGRTEVYKEGWNHGPIKIYSYKAIDKKIGSGSKNDHFNLIKSFFPSFQTYVLRFN